VAAVAHGLGRRAHDQDAFLNVSDGQPHTPGIDAECARWLAQESPVVGVGVETVGTDAGAAGGFDPPFPVHHFVLGAGKYGLTQLANLAEPAAGRRRGRRGAAEARGRDRQPGARAGARRRLS
jgi:kynurenine formamidase